MAQGREAWLYDYLKKLLAGDAGYDCALSCDPDDPMTALTFTWSCLPTYACPTDLGNYSSGDGGELVDP